MKIEAPCRLGERFRCRPPYTIRVLEPYLTGLGFFYWESQIFPGCSLRGKRNILNEREHTGFYHMGDTIEGAVIAFDVPDEVFIPGYPLKNLGIKTDAVGRVGSVNLTEESWTYYIWYGNSYGGPMKQIRTPELDKLFEPILPKRVHVNLQEFLI